MRTIRISRTVIAPAERVFDAWTDPAELAAWWWPQLAGTTYDVDARPGGRYRIHSPALGITASGVYTDVDRPRRLGFTWIWDGEGGTDVGDVEDTVIVTFVETPEGTAVTVEHTSVAHVADGGAEQGWNDVLDRLVETSSTGATPDPRRGPASSHASAPHAGHLPPGQPAS